MSASEENDNNIQPGMADDANKTNNVADNDNAAPPAAEAAVGGVRGNNTVQENNNAMMDLSPYFNTLIDTLHRNNDNQQNAAAAAGGTNNNNAPQLRSMMVSLLWNGVELIATAGRASLGQQGALFAVDTIGGSSGGNSFPSAPPAAEAAVGGVRGNNTVQENNNAMMDLSPYFNTLIDTLHRNNDNQQNAAAAAGGTNNNNAPQLRSMMVSLLWNGVELIATAGRASLGQQGALFAVDTIGGSSGGNSFPSKFAAVYLYAVAQNIVALEEVVLQGQGSIPGAGLMDLADVGMSIKQVAEIVSVSVVVVVMKLVSSNMCARVF